MVDTNTKSISLNNLGIKNATIRYQLNSNDLHDATIKKGQGVVSSLGALAVNTGEFTGRSPMDRFIVKDNVTKDEVWWSKINLPFEEDKFDKLYNKVVDYLSEKEIFVRDSFACADENYKLSIRVVNEYPWSNMFAYNMFLRPTEKELENFDFVFFMNANMEVVSLISEDILPTEEESGLVATHHPGFYKKDPEKFTYERNHRSNFYIPFGSGETYVQGCFNGGRSKEFLKMCREIKERMDADLMNKIIPVWHDESALNWYLLDKNPKILHPTYAWPEFVFLTEEKIIKMMADIGIDECYAYFDREETDPYLDIKGGERIRIIQRDKNLFGGKNKLRN